MVYVPSIYFHMCICHVYDASEYLIYCKPKMNLGSIFHPEEYLFTLSLPLNVFICLIIIVG